VDMVTSRRIFPRILHVDSIPVAALNLDTGYAEVKSTAGDCNHSFRRRGRRLCGVDGDQLLCQDMPLIGEAVEPHAVELVYLLQELVEAGRHSRTRIDGNHRAESLSFDREA